MSKKTKILFGIIALVIIGVAVIFASSRSSDQSQNPLSSTGQTGATGVASTVVEPGSDFLVTLLNLSTIRLSPALFSNPMFRSLSEVPVSLGESEVGRQNPFAPVGVSATSPLIVTTEATSVTANSARLNATTLSVLPSGTSAYFEWGATESFGSVTPAQKPTQAGVISYDISGLAPNTSYVFRGVFKQGTRTTYGDTFIFTTRQSASR